MYLKVLSRWETMKLAWSLFWFATGTPRIGIKVDSSGIELLGRDVIGSETRRTDEDPHLIKSYEQIIQNAKDSTDYRLGLISAALVCQAQGQSGRPCPSDMAAVYLKSLANGRMP